MECPIPKLTDCMFVTNFKLNVTRKSNFSHFTVWLFSIYDFLLANYIFVDAVQIQEKQIRQDFTPLQT